MNNIIWIKLILFAIGGEAFSDKPKQCPYFDQRLDACYCEEGCKLDKGLVPVMPSEVFYTTSPVFMIVLPKNDITEQIDNVCYTYMELENSHKFLLLRSIVYKNGTSDQFINIEEDRNEPGELFGGDPSCTYQDFALNVSCEGVFLAYRCFTYGACRGRGLDLIRQPGRDALYSAATLPRTSGECKRQVVAELDAFGLDSGPLVAMPELLPYKCVTALNGAPVINAYRVPPTESYFLPNPIKTIGEL